MVVGVSGSRGLTINLEQYMPEGVTKIVSGGAKGIDQCAEDYAREHDLELMVIRPDYKAYPYKVAPLMRNKDIVNECDILLAIWDGKSKGTKYTMDYARKTGKEVRLFIIGGETE